MNITIFNLDINSYEMISDHISSAWCQWAIDDEGDTITVRLSDYAKFVAGNNGIKIGYDGRNVFLDRCDFNYIKIE